MNEIMRTAHTNNTNAMGAIETAQHMSKVIKKRMRKIKDDTDGIDAVDDDRSVHERLSEGFSSFED
jgi:hypothetical protein